MLAVAFGVIASSSFLLQTRKIDKLHEARDVALPMYIVFFINSTIWIFYGISLDNLPIIVNSGLAALGTATVIGAYFRYRIVKKGKNNRKVQVR